MPTVRCRVCGVFEDDDARRPVCPRCGLPAEARDFLMEGFRSPVSVIPEDTPEAYAAKVLAKATTLGLVRPGNSDRFLRIAIEPRSKAFGKIAERIREEIAKRRSAVDFAIANTEIEGGAVDDEVLRALNAWTRGEITDEELVEIAKRA
jgi:hypothetical protein